MHTTGFDCYIKFLAIRNHFLTKKYDYFKYNGKTSASYHSYEAKKDHFWFEKLAKHYSQTEFVDFLVSNFIKGRVYIINLAKYEETDAENTYKEYIKRRESFSYIVGQELDKILENINDPSQLFKVKSGEYPTIILSYMRGEIGLDTLVALDDFIRFSKVYNTKFGDDVIWSPIATKIEKFRPFLNYDKERMRTVLNRKLLNKQ